MVEISEDIGPNSALKNRGMEIRDGNLSCSTRRIQSRHGWLARP